MAKSFEPSREGDMYITLRRVRMLPLNQKNGFDIPEGEIVVSLGQCFDSAEEKIYYSTFGLGTLPEDEIFYLDETRKIE